MTLGPLRLTARAEGAAEQVRGTLDALLAAELPGGGWTFAHAPGVRPAPATYVVGLAERLATPLGLARWQLVVVRSPGTPAAGEVLLRGYRLTGRDKYLAAARRTGDLLAAIQLGTGGWFSEMAVEDGHLAPWFETVVGRTTLDDDVTSGAVRFLLALWEETGEVHYRAAAERGLALLMRTQLSSGAWPLVARGAWKRAVWPSFEDLPSLNDAATAGPIVTLIEGARLLGRPDLLQAARRGGEWLIAVQGAAPRAGWAQQYDAGGRPAQARRFEPPALAAWESRHAIEALLALADATGDPRFCRAAGAGVTWLADSAIRRGCWARLRALDTATPLYLSARGTPVDVPAKAKPSYDWIGDFGIPGLFAHLGLDIEGHVTRNGGSVAPQRLPGDPGACPGQIPEHSRGDPRAVIARAAVLLSVLEPPPSTRCAIGH